MDENKDKEKTFSESATDVATTLTSIVVDSAKLITGVPLDYPDPLLTPLATIPQKSFTPKEAPMDDEKDKPLVDQMTDVVAVCH